MSFGEAQTLTYAKQFAEPAYLPGDWFLTRDQPVRKPYQVLLYPLIKNFPLHTVSLIARLAGYFLACVGLALIAWRLRITAAQAIVAMGIYLWFDQSLLPGLEWIFKYAESKAIAYGLILLSLWALLSERLRWAAALLGAAATMHIIVGGIATAAAGLTILSERIGSGRMRIQAVGCWCLTGSVALYFIASKFLEKVAPADSGFATVWSYFRSPHYVDISYWDFGALKSLVFIGLIGFLLWIPKLVPGNKAYRIVSRFALWTLAPFVVGLAVQPFSFAPQVLQYLPFRVADTLIALLGIILVIPIIFREVFRAKIHLPLTVMLIALVTWDASKNIPRSIEQRDRFPQGGYWGNSEKTHALYRVCGWVKLNTPAGSRIISSPKINVIPYLCERPVVVTYRDVPTGKADFAEWFRRLQDFNGGEIPSRDGYSAESEIDRNFRRMPTEFYIHLARIYDGQYLLVYKNDEVDLPLVYKTDKWYLYQFESSAE